jgi:hypothetical protein
MISNKTPIYFPENLIPWQNESLRNVFLTLNAGYVVAVYPTIEKAPVHACEQFGYDEDGNPSLETPWIVENDTSEFITANKFQVSKTADPADRTVIAKTAVIAIRKEFITSIEFRTTATALATPPKPAAKAPAAKQKKSK